MASWQELSGRLADKDWSKILDPWPVLFLSGLYMNKPVLIACSGGADSVFLVHALIHAFPGCPENMHVLHFNHGLRGSAADADEQFVREMAEELDLPFHVGYPDGSLAADEASLREARYGWLTNVYHASKAGALVLGHNADDVLESLIMAVLTGSGPAGLAAPMPVKKFADGHVRLRPLLAMKHGDIVRSLTEASIPWREDSSNQDRAYTRNWLRHECIPQLRERIPQDIYSGAVRTRELMQECLENIDSQLEFLGLDISDPNGLDVRCLVHKSTVLIRRALMSWWLRHFPDKVLGKNSMERILRRVRNGLPEQAVTVENGSSLSITSNGILKLSGQECRESRQWRSGIHWSWPSGPLFLPGGAVLSAEKITWSGAESAPYARANPQNTAWIRWEGQVLQVRQWQPGDRYQPLGAPGRRKLQDMFVDAKLPTGEKHKLPVILKEDGTIFWVPGFAPSEKCRISDPCESALKLTYQHLSSGLF